MDDGVGRPEQIQKERLAPFGVATNAEIPPPHLEEACRLTPEAKRAIEASVDTSGLSDLDGWAFIPLDAKVIGDGVISKKSEDGAPSLITNHLSLNTPIDTLIGRSLTKRGLQFQPETDRDTLIRRSLRVPGH